MVADLKLRKFEGKMRGQELPAATALRPRHPLGLPAGSVRALLTLMVVAVVIFDLARRQEVTLMWTETLMITLAHYFSSRRFLQLPPHIVEQLRAEGVIDNESQPLHMPRHSIRTLILLAFAGLAYYLIQEGRGWSGQEMAIIGTVLLYFLGMFVGSIKRWGSRGRPSRTMHWVDDLKALIVISAMLIVALAHLSGADDFVPGWGENAVLGLTLYYFGSR